MRTLKKSKKMKINYQKTTFWLFSLVWMMLYLPMYLTAQSVAVTSKEEVKCFGQNNGKITVQITGGIAPFSLVLQDANNALAQVQAGTTTATGAFTFSNLIKGTYRVKVTGASGPSFSSDNVEVTQPDALEFDAATSPMTKQVACGENTNLQVLIKSGSGTSPYTYQWSNNVTTASAVVFAGSYSCTVKDNNGCTIARNFNIEQPSTTQVNPAIQQINVGCKGDSTGQLKVSNPLATWTYSLNSSSIFSTNSIFSNLKAGQYKVQIRDNNKCLINKDSENYTILEPLEFLNAGMLDKEEDVCIVAKSKITANPTGGTSPYKYEWTGGKTTPQITDLNAQPYTCTVTDNNGCQSISNTVTVAPIGALNLTLGSPTDVSCNGKKDGTINGTISVAGSNDTYTLQLKNGATAIDTKTTVKDFEFKDLTGAIYTLIASNLAGCKVEKNFTIIEPFPIVLTIESQQNPRCFKEKNGVVKLNAIGGTLQKNTLYDFALGNIKKSFKDSVTVTFDSLLKGTYTVVVTDNKVCEQSKMFTLTEPDSLKIAINTVAVTTCKMPDGQASVTVIGGNGKNKYAWYQNDTSKFSIKAAIDHKSTGKYKCEVTDTLGCKAAQTAELVFANPPSGKLYLNPNKSILFCALDNPDFKVEYIWQDNNGNRMNKDSTQNWYYVGNEANAANFKCILTLTDEPCGKSAPISYLLTAPTTPQPLRIQANPNPNNGTFRLVANNGVDYMDVAEVKIVDMLGRIYYQADWLSENSEIELENAPRGVYILQIRLKDGQQTTTSIVVQ